MLLMFALHIYLRVMHMKRQTRSSGDPYITHPVAVTGILADMQLDHETLDGCIAA